MIGIIARAAPRGYRAYVEHNLNARRESAIAASSSRLARGVVRLLASLDYRLLPEFPLPDGHRADLLALDARGGIAIVEIKSSAADFRADRKWPCYCQYCDVFFFAIDPEFPLALLPNGVGVIVTDGFEAAMIREAPATPLHPARRRAMVLRFARTAAGRLTAFTESGSWLAEPSW